MRLTACISFFKSIKCFAVTDECILDILKTDRYIVYFFYVRSCLQQSHYLHPLYLIKINSQSHK